jgi:hypothetical protein
MFLARPQGLLSIKASDNKRKLLEQQAQQQYKERPLKSQEIAANGLEGTCGLAVRDKSFGASTGEVGKVLI